MLKAPLAACTASQDLSSGLVPKLVNQTVRELKLQKVPVFAGRSRDGLALPLARPDACVRSPHACCHGSQLGMQISQAQPLESSVGQQP